MESKNQENENTPDGAQATEQINSVMCWVAIEDKLPELEKNVLIFDKWETTNGETREDMKVGYLESYTTYKTSNGIAKHCEWGGTEFIFNITHWMELPSPPCT